MVRSRVWVPPTVSSHVRYDDPPPWDRSLCTGLTPGARELGEYLKRAFPTISTVGGYSCRANTANPTQMSVHGTGRALDLMIPTVRGDANPAGDPIANWLVKNAARIGIQYVIWNRTRWDGSMRPHVADYTGPIPHVDHIHMELNLDGANKRTPFFRPGGLILGLLLGSVCVGYAATRRT